MFQNHSTYLIMEMHLWAFSSWEVLVLQQKVFALSWRYPRPWVCFAIFHEIYDCNHLSDFGFLFYQKTWFILWADLKVEFQKDWTTWIWGHILSLFEKVTQCLEQNLFSALVLLHLCKVKYPTEFVGINQGNVWLTEGIKLSWLHGPPYKCLLYTHFSTSSFRV